MSFNSELMSVLSTCGKTFLIHKTDMVKNAIEYRSISKKTYVSHSGALDFYRERIQVTCTASTAAALQILVDSVESALFYNSTWEVSYPLESKLEGFDKENSLFYCIRDYIIIHT